MLRRTLVLLAALAVLAIPAVADDDVIFAGIDAFHTVVGVTSVDLLRNPIPAGFFCEGSAPFSGRIFLQGVPLATEPAGALGNADTVIARLDDAVFDAEGVAHTRLQAKALSMVSLRPVVTSCGRYHVAVSLVGEQPISPAHHMTIVRENEHGGYFLAEFLLQFKLTFTPVRGGAARELVRTLPVRGSRDHGWTSRTEKAQRIFPAALRVDTDNDGRPDTLLPGTSNFRLVGGNAQNKAATTIFSDCPEIIHQIE